MALMSVQAICVAACHNVEWPLLIVCPSSVTITWREALYTWLSPKVLPKPQDIHVITSGKVMGQSAASSFPSTCQSILWIRIRNPCRMEPDTLLWLIQALSCFLQQSFPWGNPASQGILQD